MSETNKPSKPISRNLLKPSAPTHGVAKPALAKPKTVKAAAPRRAVTTAAEDDEFAAMQPALPPRVVGKKKKKVRSEAMREDEGTTSGPSRPPSELMIPLILVGVGIVANALTSLMLRPDVVPLGLWLGIRMGIIFASMLVTYGALFVCAFLLDADYGFLDTGAVKVAAICLTQGWVGDLASLIHIGLVEWLLTFGTTYAMFKCFFDLEEMEVLASMFIVRLVHWLAVALLFITIMTAILAGRNITLPGADALGPAILEPEGEGDFDDPVDAKGLEDMDDAEP